MTQFAVVHLREAAPSAHFRLRALGSADAFVRGVVEKLLGAAHDCWVIADAESLIDDVWQAQQSGADLRSTMFLQLASTLRQGRDELLCWSGADFSSLPTARSLEEFERELRRQTAEQPAEFFVHFIP